jgi:hypothetical protein
LGIKNDMDAFQLVQVLTMIKATWYTSSGLKRSYSDEKDMIFSGLQALVLKIQSLHKAE